MEEDGVPRPMTDTGRRIAKEFRIAAAKPHGAVAAQSKVPTDGHINPAGVTAIAPAADTRTQQSPRAPGATLQHRLRARDRVANRCNRSDRGQVGN